VVAREQGQKVIARNRRAYHDYHIEDTYEAS
jgi:SsrA-binding protein